MPTRSTQKSPPPPSPAPDPGDLPRPLTIFLSQRDHRAVTRALRRLHASRPEALKRALGIRENARKGASS